MLTRIIRPATVPDASCGLLACWLKAPFSLEAPVVRTMQGGMTLHRCANRCNVRACCPWWDWHLPCGPICWPFVTALWAELWILPLP